IVSILPARCRQHAQHVRAGSTLPGVSGQGSWAGSSLRHSSNSTDTMLRRTIEFSLQNKFIVLLATAALVLMGGYSGAAHTSRRHSRPLGRAGDNLHRMARTGPADRPGP